jgi:transposase
VAVRGKETAEMMSPTARLHSHGARRELLSQTGEISAAVAPEAHAILVLDQAGSHVSKKPPVPGNITLLAPPKSPELNPVENIWRYMRDNWLSNRVFKSCDDILDHCCLAWSKLIDMPWKIMSIGTREWANRS